MSKRVRQAAFFACGVALAPAIACAQPQDPTRTIKRDSDAAKGLPEPSYQTREERLKAKPLDWDSTSGKPKRKSQTAAERQALERAQPASSDGGAPDPRAADEARRLYPEEWKTPDKK
jgi:hypothetical protein